MATYYNTTNQAYTITLTSTRVVRLPPKQWSEDISREEEGSAQLLKLVRKGVARRHPLADTQK